MGLYLNPGNQRFKEAVNSNIYVDKTEMISFLNSVVSTEQKYVCVSRPRRFGKSLAVNMVCAYYSINADSRNLFESTKLCEHEKWDRYLGRFNVLQINILDFLSDSEDISKMLTYMREEITDELMGAHPDIRYGSRINLRNICGRIYAATGRQFIIVIDEWDAIFRERKDDKAGQEKYLDFLRDWLKDKDYVALAYMTGILPIKKYGRHSALNMFMEYSMTSPMQLARYTGFTEDEVAALCRQYGRDFKRIKEWYDGYVVSDVVPPDPYHQFKKETGKLPVAPVYSIYNPFSVINAVMSGQIRNYWSQTENYEALAEYIRMDYDGLQSSVALMMDGGRLKPELRRYQNDMTTFHSRDDILALLIHLGYLGYDEENGEVFIPNKEILEEFKASTETIEWQPIFEAFHASQKLLEATWDQDADKVASGLEAFHDKTENKTYNSEAALSYAIQMAYYCAQKYYTTILELDSGKGYADVVYLPSPRYPEKPALLIELKYEKSAFTALDQIREKNYPERLSHYKGNLLLVAVNYDKEAGSCNGDFKHHSCLIEKV